MWIYVPSEFCQSAPASEGSTQDLDLLCQQLEQSATLSAIHACRLWPKWPRYRRWSGMRSNIERIKNDDGN
jgi:hypothetical protein